MAEMTIEQQRALAIAQARLRMQSNQAPAGLDTVGQTALSPKRDYDAELREQYDVGQAPYLLGAKVNDKLAGWGVKPSIAAGAGTAANVGMELVGMAAGGGIGNAAAAATVKPAGEGLGRWLMRTALKPSAVEANREKGTRAIQTLLDEGINVSQGGVEKLRRIGTDLNQQVSGIIAGSTAKLPTSVVDDGLASARNRFANSPDQVGDFAAIQSAGDKFIANNKLTNLGAEEAALRAEIASKNAARIQALQDSGRYQTMAAQQQNLAHGGGVNLPVRPAQPVNEPYMNVGALGDRSISTSAYPLGGAMTGQPRIAGQYTHNIERVPEAQAAAEEFQRIAKLRALEKELRELELKQHLAGGGSGIPIQTAQDLKQGIYRDLKDKYGTLQAPEAETRKAIANALRVGIEKQAPEVAPLNKHASDIWNALNVTERRAYVGGNNNPFSLPAAVSMVHSPAFGAGMIVNTSDLAKSLLARGMYQTGKASPYLGQGAGMAAMLRAHQPDE